MEQVQQSLLEWGPRYSVHVKEIDAEHQRWFNLVNRFHDALAGGRGKKVLGPMLDEIATYAVGHFAHEEKLMRASGYSGLEEHVRQHEAMRRALAAFIERHRNGDMVMSLEVAVFLGDWLREHIHRFDLPMGEAFRGGSFNSCLK